MKVLLGLVGVGGCLVIGMLVELFGVTDTSALSRWRRELHSWCEPECMTYLQSKPIVTRSRDGKVSENWCDLDAIIVDANATLDVVRRLKNAANAVLITFDTLNTAFAQGHLSHVAKTLTVLIGQVQDYICECGVLHTNDEHLESKKDFDKDAATKCGWRFPGLRLTSNNKDGSVHAEVVKESEDNLRVGCDEVLLLQQKTVLQVLDRLRCCLHRCHLGGQTAVTSRSVWSEMRRILSTMDKVFNQLSNMAIAKELNSIVAVLRPKCQSPLAIRAALNTIILLGNESSSDVAVVLGQVGAIECLIQLSRLNEKNDNDVVVLALRALSAICSVTQCIRQLEECDGLAMLCSILTSELSSTEQRLEAAGVVAQITSPWVKDNHNIKNLEHYTVILVHALTNLCEVRHVDDEGLLLATAALANLTFMAACSLDGMAKSNTAARLMAAIRSNNKASIFVRDQVVTILANVCGHVVGRSEVSAHSGLSFLLGMLEVDYSQMTEAEVAAGERVQKKAAIAISRLCENGMECASLIRLGGLERLVSLCENEAERQYNEGVLMACLTIIRRAQNFLGQVRTHDEVDGHPNIRGQQSISGFSHSAANESFV